MKNTYLLLSLLLAALTTQAQSYTPTPENLKARTWFQDAKFGLFVHWGVYSTLADGEWVMNVRKIDKKTYQKLPDFFNPIAFDAKEWVDDEGRNRDVGRWRCDAGRHWLYDLAANR